MTTKITIFIVLLFLAGCTAETTKTDIQRTHSLKAHVNGSVKLMEAEQELISDAPLSFYAYQKLRHDNRSYIVSNLRQSRENKNYVVGEGFFLIDSDYVNRSSRTELVATLIEITKNRSDADRYTND